MQPGFSVLANQSASDRCKNRFSFLKPNLAGLVELRLTSVMTHLNIFQESSPPVFRLPRQPEPIREQLKCVQGLAEAGDAAPISASIATWSLTNLVMG
jgi:hypothetical protein